jgi:hypothetical protein
MEKVAEGLRRVWPDLRPITVTHQDVRAGVSAEPRVLKCQTAYRHAWPERAVYIGAAEGRYYKLPASKWANPFRIDKPDRKRDGTRAEVIAEYQTWICDQPHLMAALPELRGRDLVCWCAPAQCRGDVLKVLANAGSSESP